MPMIAEVIVVGREHRRVAARQENGSSFIDDGLGGRGSLRKGCDVDVGLEGRAGLAVALRDINLSIDRCIVKVDAAKQGDDGASMEVDEHLCRIGHVVSIAQFSDMALGNLLYLILQSNIQRCIDNEARARQLAAREVKEKLQLRQDKVDEVGRPVAQDGTGFEEVGVLRLAHGVQGLHSGDVALRLHQAEHGDEAIVGHARIAQWIIGGRIAGYARKHSRLREIELHGGRPAGNILQAEVNGSGSIDAIGLVAVVDAVQVHLQDVALAVAAVDEGGQGDFFELTLNGGPVADDQVFNELLGDGTAAFDDASAA